MIKEINLKCKSIFIEAVNKLKGYDKRIILAKIYTENEDIKQDDIAKCFKVSRDTLRKGVKELKSGFKCEAGYALRGRNKVEDRLPNILNDINEILEFQSQIDPKFQSNRLYTKITAKEVRKQLIESKKYSNNELPTERTINTKINKLGYKLKRIQKTKPLKKIKETDEIFNNLKELHDEAKNDNKIIRLSIDAKDKVKVGMFSRGGKSRVDVEAYDHDFGKEYIIPFGIMNVKDKTVSISHAVGKITADYIVDRIEEYWLEKGYNREIKELLLNLDNGPECSSRRTQFIKRMIEFSVKYNVKITLAYYPPYHSKYNPIERVWGILEKHWNGTLLDNIDTIVKYTETMKYAGKLPEVRVINNKYESGIKVGKKEMNLYESVLIRKDVIGKWFVKIDPIKCNNISNMICIE